MVSSTHSKMMSYRKYTDFLRLIISILFLTACASTIIWIVYVSLYVEEKDDTKKNVHIDQATIAFQAVVISTLLYATAHHGVTMVKRYLVRDNHTFIDRMENDLEDFSIRL